MPCLDDFPHLLADLPESSRHNDNDGDVLSSRVINRYGDYPPFLSGAPCTGEHTTQTVHAYPAVIRQR